MEVPSQIRGLIIKKKKLIASVLLLHSIKTILFKHTYQFQKITRKIQKQISK
jgi:hypothetical protein